MKKKRKPGSGRTKGAVSYTLVSLVELNRVLKPVAKVLVSRRYADMLSLRGRVHGAKTTFIRRLVKKGLTKKQP